MNERTFQFEEDLPSLPIPDLKNSCKMYLNSVEAALKCQPMSEAERNSKIQTTRSIVEKFEKGIGQQLHKEFVTEALKQKNWLEPLWRQAYFSLRIPTALWVNYGGIKKAYPLIKNMPNKDDIQPWNGALFIYSMMLYWKRLRAEAIPVDRNARMEPMSMHQNRFVTNACRRPAHAIDEYVSYFKTETLSADCPSHVIVLCNKRIFCIRPVDLSPVQIFNLLKEAHNKAYSQPPGIGLAAMTYSNREQWYQLRSWISRQSEKNTVNLDLIEESVFYVALDPNSPKDKGGLMWRVLFGDPCNRWADKPSGFVVFKDGQLGTNCEHTPCDGIIQVIVANYADEIFSGEGRVSQLMALKPADVIVPAIVELNFDGLESEFAFETINKSLKETELFTSDIQVRHIECKNIGQTYLSSYGLSPDAFAQLVIQLAYAKTHSGKMVPIYKTGTTRRYYHGRTETVRSLTSKAVDFVQGILHMPPIDNKEKWQLLKDANDDHRSLNAACSRGKGADRHLFMLRAMWSKVSDDELDIFKDPNWELSGGNSKFYLSTSYTGNTGECGGCGPMCHDGYGVFYCSEPKSLQFLILNFKSDYPSTNGQLYLQSIDWAFAHLRAIIDECGTLEKNNSKL